MILRVREMIVKSVFLRMDVGLYPDMTHCVTICGLLNSPIKCYLQYLKVQYVYPNLIYYTGGREISAIIVTVDYLCYKEPKSPCNFFLILIFNELF